MGFCLYAAAMAIEKCIIIEMEIDCTSWPAVLRWRREDARSFAPQPKRHTIETYLVASTGNGIAFSNFSFAP